MIESSVNPENSLSGEIDRCIKMCLQTDTQKCTYSGYD